MTTNTVSKQDNSYKDKSYQDSRKALMGTYAPPEFMFTHGEGAYLYTESKEQYLDFISGIAVNSLGYGHPHLLQALHGQTDKLWHVSNLFRIPSAEELSQRLCEFSFADKVFFTNSGTESVECGLKMMRRYHFDNGNPERYRIIGTSNSFHGRTVAAVCASGNQSHMQGFVQGDQGFDYVEFNNVEAVKQAITNETAGIIVEPVQGEGGVRSADSDYLIELRKLCDEHGILLMFDEVQCGVGRTGKLFAYERYGVAPDIMSLAKGLGGGFPLGACLATENVAKHMVIGTHGSTYGGNPLATTVGNAVLDVVSDPEFLKQVEHTGEQLKAELQRLVNEFPALVDGVRGSGLMLGLHCNKIENTQFLVKAREYKLLVGKAGDNVVRLLPPLVIDSNHVSQAVDIMETVLSDLSKEA